MRRLFRRARADDRGAALALVAGSLVVLMGMAAFGSDLAWFYLNASRIQRAADAAALGGVIWLPAQPGTANATAVDIALRNGYDDGLTDVDVVPAAVPGEPNKLEVTITDVVPTFFAKILGFDTMTISRSAVAEYIPPLKLGSPDNQFGNTCDPTQPGCNGQPNFWANIHGRWTATSMGDAYSSWCTNNTDNPTCTKNTSPPARNTGYLYGIESPGTFTVEGNDLAFHNTSGGNPTSDHIRTGDRGCEDWGPSPAPDCGPTMIVNLYAPDPTPLDVSDNALLCTATLPPAPQVLPTDPYSWMTPDGDSCWSQSGAGIYVLQVMIQDPGAVTDRAGLNRYAVRATGAGAKLFGLGDFALYNNASGTTTSFYLAEVPSYYHGKTFVVELWDPGDAPGGGTLTIVDPSGSAFDAGQCRVYTRPTINASWSLINTINPPNDCLESVAPQEYNADWLKFEMDLPPEYSCTDCWWKVDYDYPGGVEDTTTWRAYMIGNPIHLVE